MFGFLLSGRSDTAAKMAAFEVLTTNLMIADTDLKIIYMNPAVTAFLTEAEADIRKDLPDFRVDGLLGRSIDAFHKNPMHQRHLLEGLSGNHKATIRIGGRVFDLNANALYGGRGQRLGTVVEWADATYRMQHADGVGQVAAISKSQAVIEFNLDGTIIKANDNFLKALGYELSEIQGRHHSMFVAPEYRESADYKEFWAALNRGEYQAAEFLRIGKGGKEVWIQASYNPILDSSGKLAKVVKFATDVTKQVVARKSVNLMIQSVAAGSEELNTSVREISEAMVRSKDTAGDAYDRSAAAGQMTQKLTEVADSMGGIVAMISGITSQINLLALNAAIESARAGDAGRGFAVVANEVKSLAGQAKSATDQITKEIKGMTSIFNEIVGSLGSIRQSIEQVREYVTSTAAAVEEQSVVASEMSVSMQKAAEQAASLG